MGRFGRRRFLTASSALLVPRLLRAQQVDRVYRVGYIVGVTPVANLTGAQPRHPVTRGFLDGMRELGYAEGKNLVLERRSAEGRPERYAAILAELIALEPDVIVVPGLPDLVKVAMDASKSTPIVSYSLVEPVNRGQVASLAHPGGNLTGLTIVSGSENEAKRIELLKETIPGISRFAYLAPSYQPPAIREVVARAARTQGIDVVFVTHDPTDFARARAEILRQRPDALVASLSSTTYGQREQLVRFMLEARLPGVCPYTEMAEGGGLLSYAVDVADLGRRAAYYVHRIFRGTKPGDLPIEQPIKFELVVNLKTARAFGLTIPQSILLRADRVIE